MCKVKREIKRTSFYLQCSLKSDWLLISGYNPRKWANHVLATLQVSQPNHAFTDTGWLMSYFIDRFVLTFLMYYWPTQTVFSIE